MTETNKRRIVLLNLTLIMIIISILLILYIGKINKSFIYFEILSGYIIFISLFILGLLIFISIIRWQLIFEYDISGEVLSIKNYKWYNSSRKIIRPVFEIPKSQITNFEIKKIYFWKYLIISFQKDSGKKIEVEINITGCSQKQIDKLCLDFKNFLRHYPIKCVS